MKAWLITWECIGDHAAVKERIVSILNPRLEHGRVKDHVDQLWLDTQTYNERLEVIRGRREPAYATQYHTVNGRRFLERMDCGHNPFLYARKVENLRVEEDENGEERLVWDEIPLPEIPI